MLIAQESISQTDRKRFQMDLQFSDLQQIIWDKNEITKVALECAVLVFRRARELPPEQQKPVLAIVKDLISVKEDQEDLNG
jgi:hypothetical protein